MSIASRPRITLGEQVADQRRGGRVGVGVAEAGLPAAGRPRPGPASCAATRRSRPTRGRRSAPCRPTTSTCSMGTARVAEARAHRSCSWCRRPIHGLLEELVDLVAEDRRGDLARGSARPGPATRRSAAPAWASPGRASAARTGRPPPRRAPASCDANAISMRRPDLLGRLATEADAAAGLGELDEVDRLQLDAVLGVAQEDHLLPLDLAERVVLDDDDLDRQLVLDGRDELAAISIVKPPSPTKATTWRSGKATWRRVGVGQARGHRGQVARAGELHAPAHLEVPRRPGGDRARVGRDDRVVGEQVVDVPRRRPAA